MYAMRSTSFMGLQVAENDPPALRTATAFFPAATRGGSGHPDPLRAADPLGALTHYGAMRVSALRDFHRFLDIVRFDQLVSPQGVAMIGGWGVTVRPTCQCYPASPKSLLTALHENDLEDESDHPESPVLDGS